VVAHAGVLVLNGEVEATDRGCLSLEIYSPFSLLARWELLYEQFPVQDRVHEGVDGVDYECTPSLPAQQPSSRLYVPVISWSE
jgi:hypothetical protein